MFGAALAALRATAGHLTSLFSHFPWLPGQHFAPFWFIPAISLPFAYAGSSFISPFAFAFRSDRTPNAIVVCKLAIKME